MYTKGFTLPELLTALAVIGMLLLVSQPLLPLLASMEVHNRATALATTLRYARTQAVNMRSSITVQSLDDDWGKGWRVFVDSNRNAQLDAGETLLSEFVQPSALTIAGNAPVASYIHYSALGSTHLLNGGFQAGTLYFCDSQATAGAYKLILSKTGRTRVENADFADCLAAKAP